MNRFSTISPRCTPSASRAFASNPIFNSAPLASYFRKHGHGIFKRIPEAQETKDYAVFEHVINRMPRQSLIDMKTRRERVCAVYARPEPHAARNLYEFIELVLKRLCRAGRFGPDWRFIGLGSLSQLPPVELGGGHRLEFLQKMSEENFRNFAVSIDLGISLMYSPHPSIIPFELCTTGAIVVTNTFENRQKDFFAAISPDIIAIEPTLDALEAAIENALDRVEDFEFRWSNTYEPASSDWSQTFSAEFIESTIGNVLR
jgi:hypothetical protein